MGVSDDVPEGRLWCWGGVRTVTRPDGSVPSEESCAEVGSSRDGCVQATTTKPWKAHLLLLVWLLLVWLLLLLQVWLMLLEAVLCMEAVVALLVQWLQPHGLVTDSHWNLESEEI